MRQSHLRDVLDDAVIAARAASDRAELWIPGALTWVTFLGWLPLLATVMAPPSESDLAFLGSRIVSSSAWPLNGFAIGAGAVIAVGAAAALGALGQAALDAEMRGPDPRGMAHAGWRILVVRCVAAAPALAAVAALALGVAAVAPDEFQSPDIGGGVGVRIAGRVMPLLVVLAATVLLAPPLAAAVERRVTGARAESLRAATRGGLGDLLRAPLGGAVVTLAALVVRLGYLAAAWLLLRVLWAPIAAGLGAGGGTGIDATTALLLVGFMAIWCCLVVGGGVLNAWVAAWWTLVLAAARTAGPARQPSVEGLDRT